VASGNRRQWSLNDQQRGAECAVSRHDRERILITGTRPKTRELAVVRLATNRMFAGPLPGLPDWHYLCFHPRLPVTEDAMNWTKWIFACKNCTFAAGE
jgi:hypothetical protein